MYLCVCLCVCRCNYSRAQRSALLAASVAWIQQHVRRPTSLSFSLRVYRKSTNSHRRAATQLYCLHQGSLYPRTSAEGHQNGASREETSSFEGHESPDNRTTRDRSKCQTPLLAQPSTNVITVVTHATRFQDFVQYRSCSRPLEKFPRAKVYNRTASVPRLSLQWSSRDRQWYWRLCCV